MPIYLGSDLVTPYIGSDAVKEIYLGSTLVYQNMPPYTSGMDVWLDGIKNTSGGHSNSTPTWADLSGNNNNATVVFGSGDSWSSDSANISSDSTKITVPLNLYTSSFTVEFVVKLSSLYNYGTLMRGVQSNGTRDAWITSGGNIVLRVASSYDTSSTAVSISALNTIAFVVSGNTEKYYLNGTLIGTYSRTVSAASNTSFRVFADSSTANRHIKGQAYSFRHYSSALTDAQIRRNRAVDVNRFL